MPVQLPSFVPSGTNLAGSINLTNLRVSALPREAQGPYASIEVINASGCDLQFNYPNTGAVWPVPAGRNRVIPVPPGESLLEWIVLTAYPSAFGQTCYAYYFDFNEQPTDLGVTNGIQLGFQPRGVNIPLAPDYTESVSTNPTNGTDMVHLITNLQPAVLAAGFCFWYMYYLRVTIDPPAAGTIAGMNFTVVVEVKNASNVVIATSTPINHGGVNSGQGAAATGQIFAIPYELRLEFAWPMSCGSGPSVPFPAGSTAHLRIHCTGVTGALTSELIIAADVDQTGNLAAPGAIGLFSQNVGPY